MSKEIELSFVCVECLANTSHKVVECSPFIEREVDSVILDSVIRLNGEEFRYDSLPREFVSSFSSEEENKFIIQAKLIEGRDQTFKLTASYDHTTQVISFQGEGYHHARIRIFFKDKSNA